MKRDNEARRTGKKLSPERGRCIACVKFQPNARFVDLGGELPRIGKLYICSSCVDRCRQVLGYATQAGYEKTIEELDKAGEKISSLENEIGKLKQQLDASLRDVIGDALLRARDIDDTA